jgi:hypothetical protein
MKGFGETVTTLVWKATLSEEDILPLSSSLRAIVRYHLERQPIVGD